MIRKNALRWSMKPVFIRHLLEQGIPKVIYIDCDMFFFSEGSFLFSMLDETDFLLTPHWRSIDPLKETLNFRLLFTDGIYNAGFIGASANSIPILDWWANACLYECKKRIINGLFDDQRYLDIVPVYFEKTGIVSHKGCNVANWNQAVCRREAQPDGTILINGKEPIVFIHFSSSTITGILHGNDILLKTHLEKYAAALSGQDPSIHLIEQYPEPGKPNDTLISG